MGSPSPSHRGMTTSTALSQEKPSDFEVPIPKIPSLISSSNIYRMAFSQKTSVQERLRISNIWLGSFLWPSILCFLGCSDFSVILLATCFLTLLTEGFCKMLSALESHCCRPTDAYRIFKFVFASLMIMGLTLAIAQIVQRELNLTLWLSTSLMGWVLSNVALDFFVRPSILIFVNAFPKKWGKTNSKIAP